jgi:hypothetical protein
MFAALLTNSASAAQHQAVIGMMLRATYRVLSEAHPQLLNATAQKGGEVLFLLFATAFFAWAIWQLIRTRPTRSR